MRSDGLQSLAVDAAHGHALLSMDRREFFNAALRKTGRVVVEQAERKAARQAAAWVRPPFALKELDFLLNCTRCGACVQACPHGVVFLLGAKVGAQATGTPALDLLHRGCRLCKEWPCVSACEAGALRLPETDGAATGDIPPPRIAVAEIRQDQCLPYLGPECGACAGSCPVPGALHWRGHRPHIDSDLCTGCALCREACILDPKAIRIHSVYGAHAV